MFLCWSLICNAVIRIFSIFFNHLFDEERAGCLTLIVFLLFCDCQCLCLFLSVPWISMWSVIMAFPSNIYLFLFVKYNVDLKAFLQQVISEPVIYGDLVYNLKRIIGKTIFTDEFKKIIQHFKKNGI